MLDDATMQSASCLQTLQPSRITVKLKVVQTASVDLHIALQT